MSEKKLIYSKIFDIIEELDSVDQIELLLNLLVKCYLTRFENDKPIFMQCCSEMYDSAEEQGNFLGFI